MKEKYNKLISDIRSYNKQADFQKIDKAWEFAKISHTDQKRLSGEDFVNHPLEIAQILADWKLDSTSIIAALLHDTIEDGGASKEDILNEFGENVSLLVDGVTKITEIRLKEESKTVSKDSEQEFIENLRKIFLVMAKDLRVVLIKLADRLHNMQSLSYLPKESQISNARETMEIYAPLAERFGIGEVKGQLEDLAFPYIYPKDYEKVKKLSKPYYHKADTRIKKMRRSILTQLHKQGIKADISGRKKHIYSLWKKLERFDQDWDFDQINDIVALRILVDKTSDCYVALGVVHDMYKPVPHKGLSDFIAQPKPNGYQSIHTKVFGPVGKITEVQIRTYAMHEQAEHGIAAHWSYGEAKSKGTSDDALEAGEVRVSGEKLAWVRQLVKWQEQIADSEDFMDAVKFDALSHRNYIFSPNGDVYDLPSGATPIDFACAVHTDLIKYIKMAKVDGRIVPLDYKLKSGDVVEIVKTKEPRKPSKDWLDCVVTREAKKKIRNSLKG